MNVIKKIKNVITTKGIAMGFLLVVLSAVIIGTFIIIFMTGHSDFLTSIGRSLQKLLNFKLP